MKSIDAAGDDESAISTSASDDTCGRSGGVDQTTAYSYGPSGSDADDSLLLAVEYPDPTTGDASNEVTYTYNSDGSIATMTDRDGTVHSYEYDDDGNQIADVITKLGTGVDGTVMQRDTDYNDLGQPVDYTTKNAAGGILSEVEETYDGDGDVIAEAQSHDGAVGEDTPTASYGYQETAGGQDRQTSLTYPDEREVDYGYGSSGSLTDAEGWVDTVSDANDFGDDTLASYSYMGDGTMVGQSRPQTGANEAITLDNFGDIADLNWTTSADTSTDHYGFGYDADGNVMYKENYVDTADSELYHVSGASGGYDGLNRLTSFSRGTLSTSTGGVMLDTISSPSTTQSWDLDALGNQTEVTTNGTEQTRTQNGQNQTTSVTTGDTTNNLTYDANGATTTDEDGRVWTYDAWGDPVSVSSSSGTLIETDAFDALGRRITVTTYSGGTPTTTDLYYTTAGQVIEEDQGGEPISQTIYGPNYVNSIIEVDQATGSPGTLNQRIYVQQDANYNVTSVTDTSGTVLERYIYSPYGTQTVLNPDGTVKGDGTPASSSYNLPVGYQGMLFDPVLSDNLTPNRVYDPMLGTWTEEDPSGYGDGADLYGFAVGNPAGSTDPAGLADQAPAPAPTSQPAAQPVPIAAPPPTAPPPWWLVLGPPKPQAVPTSPPPISQERADALAKGEPGSGPGLHVNCAIWATRNVNLAAASPKLGEKGGHYKLPAGYTAEQEEQYSMQNAVCMFDAWDETIKVSKGFQGKLADPVPPPAGYHKIAVYRHNSFTLTGGFKYDYHVITQSADGTWSGKGGWDNVISATSPQSELRTLGAVYIGCWYVPGPPRASMTELNGGPQNNTFVDDFHRMEADMGYNERGTEYERGARGH